MKGPRDYSISMFGPQKEKTFAGALSAFFKHECPHLGGDRIRSVLVKSIVDLVDQFYPATTHLRPGQIQWTTVDKNAAHGYGRKVAETRLTSVTLDLVADTDAEDRVNCKSIHEIRREALARLCKQAYEQGGCLTTAELCILLKASSVEITRLIREWETEHEELLPRRGTIHDLGPSVTHKKVIIEKLFLQGKTVEDVMRETNHSADAVHRYIVSFKQVVLCRKKGLHSQEIAFAIKMSERLVKEYEDLIDELSKKNPAFEDQLASRLNELLNARRDSGT
jgi:hypothetical protein